MSDGFKSNVWGDIQGWIILFTCTLSHQIYCAIDENGTIELTTCNDLSLCFSVDMLLLSVHDTRKRVKINVNIIFFIYYF